jgi:RHS repeat-associated protein
VVEYYDVDAIGSVRAVTDAQGQVVARHDFVPFGEELNPQTPPHDKHLFTGQERDVETGQDYVSARQLRTDVGRFTTPDPGHVNGTVEDPPISDRSTQLHALRLEEAIIGPPATVSPSVGCPQCGAVS